MSENRRFSWSFHVTGLPAPKGSKNLGAHGNLYESSKAVKPWQDSVIAAVLTQTRRNLAHLIDCAACVDIDFHLKKPQRVRDDHTLPVTKPDIDKLVRSTLDGLVLARLLDDDALVTDLHVKKRYTSQYFPEPGASIRVYRIHDMDGVTLAALR